VTLSLSLSLSSPWRDECAHSLNGTRVHGRISQRTPTGREGTHARSEYAQTAEVSGVVCRSRTSCGSSRPRLRAHCARAREQLACICKYVLAYGTMYGQVQSADTTLVFLTCSPRDPPCFVGVGRRQRLTAPGLHLNLTRLPRAHARARGLSLCHGKVGTVTGV